MHSHLNTKGTNTTGLQNSNIVKKILHNNLPKSKFYLQVLYVHIRCCKLRPSAVPYGYTPVCHKRYSLVWPDIASEVHCIHNRSELIKVCVMRTTVYSCFNNNYILQL